MAGAVFYRAKLRGRARQGTRVFSLARVLEISSINKPALATQAMVLKKSEINDRRVGQAREHGRRNSCPLSLIHLLATTK